MYAYIIYSVYIKVWFSQGIQKWAIWWIYLFIYFLRNLYTVYHKVSVYIPTNRLESLPFLHTLSAFIICRFFDDGHSDLYEMITHCGFDLHFSNC